MLEMIFPTALQGRLTDPAFAVTVGVSPFTHVAKCKQGLIIRGGTVSLVEYRRNGVNLGSVGFTAGIVELNESDSITVTYIVLPTIIHIPR